LRYRLAKKAFSHTAAYDTAISTFLSGKGFEDVRQCYEIRQVS